MKIILYGDPRTKKNSQRAVYRGKHPRILHSAAFVAYQKACLLQIRKIASPICESVNVQCVYYMQTRRKVDLANLIEATTDILVAAKILADDNSKIVAAHDGSRVYLHDPVPRAEITIERLEEQ